MQTDSVLFALRVVENQRPRFSLDRDLPPSFRDTNKSLFPYEHMGFQFSFLMSQMGHNEHGRPQLSRCPAIIMRPSASYSIFISILCVISLIKRLRGKVSVWQQMSREFLTKCLPFLCSPARRPGSEPLVKGSDSPLPVFPCRRLRCTPRLPQSSDVYSYSQYQECINCMKMRQHL